MRFIVTALVLLSLSWPSATALLENTLYLAKVGDWVTIRTTFQADGKVSVRTVRHTVISKDDKTVTIRTVTVFPEENPAPRRIFLR